jgi:hypothetical protein
MEGFNPRELNKDYSDQTFSEEEKDRIKGFYMEALKEELQDGDLNEEIINNKVEGEESFFKRVFQSVATAIDENPNKEIIALFDIDETLVSPKMNDEEGYDHIIRPSATNLLNAIKNIGSKVGFLTARGSVVEQLDNELIDFEKLIDKDHIYVTRNFHVSLDKEREISDKYIDFSLSNGDIEKTAFLGELNGRADSGNRIFIPIDDLQYPKFFDYGVSLKDKEKIYL